MPAMAQTPTVVTPVEINVNRPVWAVLHNPTTITGHIDGVPGTGTGILHIGIVYSDLTNVVRDFRNFDITMTGSTPTNGWLGGFLYVANPATNPFTGSLTGGNVTVESSTLSLGHGDTAAMGVHFRNIGGGHMNIDNGATITFRNITVSAESGAAFGFAAGSLGSGASVNLGNVWANHNGLGAIGPGNAIAVNFGTGHPADPSLATGFIYGTVITGDLFAGSTAGEAAGFIAEQNIASSGSVRLGNITVVGAAGDPNPPHQRVAAIGVDLRRGNMQGSLETGNIHVEATGTGQRAIGIRTDMERSGTVTGSISAGNIHVETTGRESGAIGLQTGNIDARASINIDRITARVVSGIEDDAFGIHATNISGGTFNSIIETVASGQINWAHGIHADNIDGGMFNGSINARVHGNGNTATGIHANGNISNSIFNNNIEAVAYGDFNMAAGVTADNISGGTFNSTITARVVDDRGNTGNVSNAVGVDVKYNISGGTFSGTVTAESFGTGSIATGIAAAAISGATFDDIIVNANGAGSEAVGVRAGGINGSIFEGAINTTANDDGGRAIGIFADAPATFTLANNITASATGINGTACGIFAFSGANITLANDVTIMARGDGDAIGIEVYRGDLTIRGNGRANAGSIHVGGNFTIGEPDHSTIVAIDGVKMDDAGAWLGNVRFANPTSRLEIDGNTPLAPGQVTLGTFVEGNLSQIRSIATFTNWGVDDRNIITNLGLRSRAYANDNYLAATQIHQRFTGWHAVRDHLISGAVIHQPSNMSRYMFLGQAPCDCTFACTPIVGCGKSRKSTRGAWVNYIGRHSRYRSSYNDNDWRLGSNGVQVGTDFIRTRRNQFGAFFGYENSTGRNLDDRLTSQDYYVGLYGVHVFNNAVDMRTIFTYGWQNFDSLRNHGGTGHRMKFDGNTAEVTLELGRRNYFGNVSGNMSGNMNSIRPVIAFDWYLRQLHGGVENPANAGAIRYGKMDVSQLFFRYGLDWRKEAGRFAIECGLYHSFEMQGNSLRARVWDASDSSLTSTLEGSRLGRSVLSFNVASSYVVGNNFTIFGGYRGEITSISSRNGYAHIGYIGGAWNW